MAVIAVAFVVSQFRQREGATRGLPILFTVSDFTLTNQNNQAVSLADLHGQLWVADIIFTRCAGPCPEMTRRMGELQAALPAGSPVKLVTLTTDPESDTPEVLKSYARRFGAEPGRWLFLTGAKAQVVRLAVDGLKLAVQEKKPEERESEADLFIHSTLFVLVDRQGRARAVFESSEPDTQSRLMEAIRILLREK